MQTDIKPGDKVVCLRDFVSSRLKSDVTQPKRGRYYTVTVVHSDSQVVGLDLAECPVPAPFKGWELFDRYKKIKNFEKVVKSSQSVEDMIRLAKPVKLLEKL